MHFFAMDMGWKRVPILLILLIFWKNAVGYKGWISHAVQSNQNRPVHKILSPQGAQSSVLEAPVTGSIPLKEVASNGLAWKRPDASRSRFSLSPNYVKGGISSSYVSMSPTQSAPSSSVSASLVLPLNQQRHGSSFQFQGTSSQYAPVSLDAKVPVYSQAAPSGSSLLLNRPSQWQPSTSRWSHGFQTSGTATSQNSSPSQGSKAPSRFSTLTSAASPGHFFSPQAGSGSYSGLSSQSQSASSQYIPGSPTYARRGSSVLAVSSQATRDQGSYKVYTSSSTRGAGAQLAGSNRNVPMQTGSPFTDVSSLQLQDASSQFAPITLDAKVPVYSQAAPSGSSVTLNQLSQLKPATSRWSHGFQTSGKATLESSSPSQGSKAPSRFSTPTSAVRSGLFSSTQPGSGSYSGLSSQSQSASSQYIPGSPAYAKRGSSVLAVSSQVTRDQGSYKAYTSSSTQGAGAQLAGSRRSVPMQTGSPFTDGSSLQLQGASSQNAPIALDAKMPVYSQAAPSGSTLSLNRPPQWQPSTSRWSHGFQTSGTATSQNISPSQGSKAPSRFSTLTSAASPGHFSYPQAGSGSYSGLSSQSQSASSQYIPGSPTYARRGSSVIAVSSQATRDQGSYKAYTSSSTQGAGAQLAGARRNVPMQTGSLFTDVSSLQLQGTSSQYAPITLAAKVPVYSQAAPSGSSLSLSQLSQLKPATSRWSHGFQTSGKATLQSSSSPQTSQLSTGSSFMPALSSPVNSVAQSSQPSMRPFQAASGSVILRQKSPGLFASVQRPMGSVSWTSSLGSNVQAASQGMFSGLSSDSTSVISSGRINFIQKPSGSSRPSQSAPVKG